MRILSVDDNLENLYLIERLMLTQGHAVTSAHNGLEALQELERGSFDLIVSDILMPEMDGYQLCHEVKSHQRTQHIPFVFYTATYTERRDEELALSLGASRFILKPTDPDEFIAMINDVSREAPRDRVSVPEFGPNATVDYLTAYNSRLVHKLDQKIDQLENAKRELQAMLEERDREIAHRKRAEDESRRLGQQLAHSQKMEAIGQLAGGVAHDFNNLLTVILGYADLLQKSHSELDPAWLQAREIANAASRAATLTRQLLAFSRKQALRFANLDINAVIRDSENMLRRLIGEDIEIQITCAPEELRTLADSGQLLQVIMNLAVNARDAMPNGGVLTIETAGIEVSSEEYPDLASGSYLRLVFRDSGVGMDPSILSRAFEPFFTTKEIGAGTGLGLSTVYGIIKQSNGHISVESNPGDGTCFHIYLPRVSGLPEPTPATPPPARSPKSETILVVEDDSGLRGLACLILRRAGYKVSEAANGREALLRCGKRDDQIALMITDIVMPGMDGRTLAQQVAIQRPEIKVLYMSGYGRRVDLDDDGLQHEDCYISKPFTPEEFITRVRLILDRT